MPGTPINPDRPPEFPRHPGPDELRDARERAAYEPTIVCLCTGNAARSPIAQVLLESLLPGANVRSAGTHVLDGQPVSWRTRFALEVVRPSLAQRINRHRSHQITAHDVEIADLVLAMAAEHVEFVRREFPEAAARTGTVRRLVRDLEAGHLSSLPDRLAHLDLAHVELGNWEEVDDPAGGDVEDFARCAQDLDGLVTELATRLAMRHFL